jgi:L,D-peptidoglycan transpeptidase YkuD (ErfK/YbiS/YcfS/YnhG family)
MAITRPYRRYSTGTALGYQRTLQVFARSRSATWGRLRVGWLQVPCALGRGGRSHTKREGDGATPSGTWRPKLVLYRPDRLKRPRTGLPTRPLRPDDGWCDAVGDRNYNRHVRHPYPASAERLWRSDGVYDVIVVLDHNTRPRVRGAGSAIFVHLARPDLTPTEGCIALSRRDLLLVLAKLGRGTRLAVA